MKREMSNPAAVPQVWMRLNRRQQPTRRPKRATCSGHRGTSSRVFALWLANYLVAIGKLKVEPPVDAVIRGSA
jgi:hypothetical protein